MAAFTGRRYIYGGLPRFAAQLELEYTDGTREIIATDATWRAAIGPIRYADILQGCSYDGRLNRAGWDRADFDDSGWSTVAVGLRRADPAAAAPPEPAIEAATIDPVRVSDELPAQRVSGAKMEVIDTAYGAYLSGLMSEMAAAIGRSGDAARFALMHRQQKEAFQRAFLLPDGGVRDSSQTGFALAFTMDLLPDALKSAAAGQFVADIASRDWHLATGFIGTPRLLPALHLAGRDDVAYRLLLQDSYPSWLFPLKYGATTMWERWDGWTPERGFQSIIMNSFNHYAFGAVGEYLYRFVAGIDTDGPGFRRILIQPCPGPGLTAASARAGVP